jgi:hypothetical protein
MGADPGSSLTAMAVPTPAAPTPAAPPAPARRRRGFDRRAYHDPRPSRTLIHALSWLNRAVVLPRLARLAVFDLPQADLARLRAAVHPGTAAFVGPNHPEFFTDWMIDKELSSRVSPLMAHWASYEIVNVSRAAQWMWLRNNLIANVPGGGGREYSIRWALAGHGVLLHPEGTASWHGERVGPLLPGIVDMAWETCRRAAEAGRKVPVFIVPVSWRLRFAGDVAPGLSREMAHIERVLGLPCGDGLPVEARFAALQWNLLRERGKQLGLPVPAGADPDRGGGYFAAQAAAVAAVTRELEARGARVDHDLARIMHRARRSARTGVEQPERERDRQLHLELWRLEGFPPDLYDVPRLTQEQIAENLKRLRTVFVTRGRGDALHNVVPVPVGRRLAHVRVPEPLAVHEAFAADASAPEAAKARLLGTLRSHLQGSLDSLGAELAPLLERSRRANPLWTGRAD